MDRTPDQLRRRRIADGLAQAGVNAVICALPVDVLLLTGYRPVLGDALALATRQGRIALLAPEDERTLAEADWADDLRAFEPSSLDSLRPLDEVVREPLEEILREMGPERARIGYEGGLRSSRPRTPGWCSTARPSRRCSPAFRRHSAIATSSP